MLPRFRLLILVIFALFVGLAPFNQASFLAVAATGINRTIAFQGRVINQNGTNVSSGSYSFTFALYNQSSGGAAVWSETKTLTVTDSIFGTYLGDTTAFATSFDFNQDNLYLGINFNADGEMEPRIRLAAVAQAFSAEKVNGLTVTTTTGTLTIPNSTSIVFGGAFTSAGTVNLAGNFTTAGANPLTLTTTGTTDVTLPLTGTLATLAGSEVFTNKTLSTGSVWQGGVIGAVYGGTGQSAVTSGDVLYGSAANTWSRLGIGSSGQCLTVVAGIPAWGSCAASGSGSTLQATYDNGNTITTTDARDLTVTLANTATDSDLVVDIATSSNSRFRVKDNGTDILSVGTGSPNVNVTGTLTVSSTLTASNGLTVSSGSVTLPSSSVAAAALVDSGVVAGSYGSASQVPSITVDLKGRATAITNVTISLDASQITAGILPIVRGGTGASSLATNGVLYGNGTSAIGASAAGTPGQLLVANASAVPTFVSLGGDASLDASGVLTIGAGAVSNSKLANSSLTVSAGTGLAGGGSVALGSSTTLNLADTAVTPASYGSTSQVGTFTVDQQGRLTAAANVTITPAAIGGVPTSRTLTAGAGLTGGGDLSADRTFTVGAGTNITVNADDIATVMNPAFTTSVTTPLVTNAGTLALSGTGASGLITLSTNGSERARIDENGNTSIGSTSTANGFLTIQRDDAGAALVIRNTTDTSTTFSVSDAGVVGTGTWNATAIGVGYGGTGLTSYTIGDLIYASGATTLAQLADVATGSILASGGVGAAPTWSTYASLGLPTGTGVSNYVARWTGTNTLGTGALYDDGTSVGIGTASPQRKLHISTSSTGTLTAAAFENTDTTNANGTVFSFRSATTGTGAASFVEFGGIQSINVEHDHATRKGSVSLFATNAGTLSLATLYYNGNFGVNNTTPGSRLTVKGSGTTSATSSLNVTNSSSGSLLFVQDDGNVGVGTATPTAAKLQVAGTLQAEGTLTVTTGGITVTGNSTITGTLGGLTGLTVASGGASITGGIDNNSGGITEAGAISGATTLALSGAITGATATDTINGIVINSGVISTATWNATTIGVGYGGTGLTSYTIGDLIYASGATTLAKLADVATGSILASGGVGAAPTWSSYASLGLPSGTGADTYVTYWTGTNTQSGAATFTFTSGTGQLALSTTGSGAGILIGGDTQLYRSAADVITTPDSLVVGANLTVSTLTAGSIPYVGTSGLISQNNSLWYIDAANGTIGLGGTRTGAISGTNSRVRVIGSGATSTTSALGVVDSGGLNLLRVRDDGFVNLGSSTATNLSSVFGRLLIQSEAGSAGNIYQFGWQAGEYLTAALGHISSGSSHTAALLRTFNSLPLTIDVAGTVAATFSTAGQLQLPVTGSAGGVSIGADAQLYRSAADILRTPDSLTIDGTLLAGTYLGQSSITTLGTIGTGTWAASTIGVAYGGTGLTSYTIGDLIYASGATTLAKLADVATGNVLISGGVGAAPSWGKVTLGTHTTGNYVSTAIGTADRITVSSATGDVTFNIAATYVGQSSITTLGTISTGTWAATTVGVAYGGTGIASYTIGDLIYASGATTLAKLADVATGSILASGGVGAAPTWSSYASLGLPTGTGVANRVTFWNGTNTLSSDADFTFDGTNLFNNIGSDSTYADIGTFTRKINVGGTGASDLVGYTANITDGTNNRRIAFYLSQSAGEWGHYLSWGSGSTPYVIRFSSNLNLSLDNNGQLALPRTGSTAGLLLGGDALLYRSAADRLYTPDELQVNTGLGVGTTPSTLDKFTVATTTTDTTGVNSVRALTTSTATTGTVNVAGGTFSVTGITSGDSLHYRNALYAYVGNTQVASGVTDNGYANGVYVQSMLSNTGFQGTLNVSTGYYAQVGLYSGSGGGTINVVYGTDIVLYRSGAGSIGNYYGLRLTESGSTTTITGNRYGIYENLATGAYNYLVNNTSIGTSVNATQKLSLAISGTDTSGLRLASGTLTSTATTGSVAVIGINASITAGTTSTATHQRIGINANMNNTTVSTGVTDSGYAYGFSSSTIISNSGFLGTLAGTAAYYGNVGLYTGSGAGTITNAYGALLYLYRSVSGTIGNYYGIRLEESGTTTTISGNRYGIYETLASGAYNYFGNNVGIGVTIPTLSDVSVGTASLHVAGSTSSSGSYYPVARFQGGAEGDGTGGMIIINNTNDRGLFISGGRSTGDYSIGKIGLVGTAGQLVDVVTLASQTAATAATTYVGINTTGPDKRLDILDTSAAQLRLTYTDSSVYTDFQTNSSGYLVLTPSGGIINSSASITGATWNATTIGVAYGGTGLTSYTIGDLIYASGATTLAKLADVATGSVLVSGGVGAAPAWSTLATAGIVSGTGIADYTARWTGTNTLSTGALRDNGSQVAIGGAPVTANMLYLYDAQTDAYYSSGTNYTVSTTTVTDGATRTMIGLRSGTSAIVTTQNSASSPRAVYAAVSGSYTATGLTNTGNTIALYGDARITSSSHQGTISTTYGAYLEHGFSSTATGSGVVTNTYGMRILLNLSGNNTGTTSYGLHIGETGSGSTITTKYGIYENLSGGYNYFAGNIGLGVTPVAERWLYMNKSTTDPATASQYATSFSSSYTSTDTTSRVLSNLFSTTGIKTTANGSLTLYALYPYTLSSYVATGITNTGSIAGVYADVYINNSSHAGTLANQYGYYTSVGLGAAATGGGTITNSFGNRTILQRGGVGTISTFYGLSIEESGSTSTVTNKYGIYEQLTSGSNYLANSTGIGTSASATYKLDVAKSATDASVGAVQGIATNVVGSGSYSTIGGRFEARGNTTGTATQTRIGVYSAAGAYTQVASGVTDSGYAMGTYNSVLLTNAGFLGTLSALYGTHTQVGFNTGSGAGTVTTAYGNYVALYRTVAGTITTYYGNYLAESGSTTTVTNRYGIYESMSSGAVNYLANRLAIGTTTANAALTVANALTLTSANWGTTTGAGLRVTHGTITDSDGSGTIASRLGSSFSQPTFASSSSVTVTDAATLYIANAPAAGTNTTITNPLALWVDAGNVRFDASLGVGGAPLSTAKLYVTTALGTNYTSGSYGTYSYLTGTTTDGASRTIYGLRGETTTQTSTLSATTYATGVYGASIYNYVDTGLTDSGRFVGVMAAAYINTANHLGTIASLQGLRAEHGFGTGAGAGTVTDSIGVYSILNRAAAGTITSAYGLYLIESGSTTTVSNKWGVYEAMSSGTVNLFTNSIRNSALTASRLMYSDGSKNLASVSDLTAWVAGTSNRLTVADDADGSVTLDISASYVGQSSITTLGTIGTGTWAATTVGVAYGGTGLTSYTIGDLIYASGATTLAKLADVATGSILASGGVGAAPTWSTYASLGLPTGTGAANRVTFWDGTNTLSSDADFTFDGALLKVVSSAADTEAFAVQRYSDTSQYLAMTLGAGGSDIVGKSATNNAKPIRFNSTTNATHDVPSSGYNYYDFLVRNTQFIKFGLASTTMASGSLARFYSTAFTDTGTAASGTAATALGIMIQAPTFAATNSSVTTTDAASLYVSAAPIAGTNQTITNPYALWIDAGASRFDGAVSLIGGGLLTLDSGNINLAATAMPQTSAINIDRSGGSRGITLRTTSASNNAPMIIWDDAYTPNSATTRFAMRQSGSSFVIANYPDGGSFTTLLTLSNAGVITTATWNATTIGVGYGGTGLTSYTIGDLIYASGATTLAKLADVATGSILASGGVGAAPTWSTYASLGLPTGTGADTYVTYWNGTNTQSGAATFTFTSGTGQLALSTTGSGAGILIGGDTQLYQTSADILRTPDSLQIDSMLALGTTPLSTQPFQIVKSFTDQTTTTYGAAITLTNTLTDGSARSTSGYYSQPNAYLTTASGTLNAYGMYINSTISYVASGLTNSGQYTGVFAAPYINSASHAGTLSVMRGFYGDVGLASGATGGGIITSVIGFQSTLERGGVGTISNYYGLYLIESGSTTTVTSKYGIYEALPTGTATNFFTNDLLVQGSAAASTPRGLKVRYTTSDSNSASLGFQGLQLGNNGVNYMVAGNTSTGGYFRFVTNNTVSLGNGVDYSTYNGTVGATINTWGIVGGPGANPTTINDGGASSTFTPTVAAVTTSGVAGVQAYVIDGTNNRRAGLFVDNTNSIWGLSSTYSSGGQIPFVIKFVTTESLRLTSAGNLSLPVTGSGAGLSMGGDTQIYRNGADVIYTPDSFYIGATSNLYGITVINTLTSPSGTSYTAFMTGNFTVADGSSNRSVLGQQININGMSTTLNATVYRVGLQVISNGSYSTVTDAGYIIGVDTGGAISSASHTGSIATVYGIRSQPGFGSSSTAGSIGTVYGAYIVLQRAATGTATITGSTYGVYITEGSTTPVGGTRYGIYEAMTAGAFNRFNSNIGINITPSATYQLYGVRSTSDLTNFTSGAAGIYSSQTGLVTDGTTRTLIGIRATTNTQVTTTNAAITSYGFYADVTNSYAASTISNTGSVVGLVSVAYINTANHVGSIAAQYGTLTQFGIYTNGGGSITTAYGMRTTLYKSAAGTITTAYSLYLSDSGSTTTITTNYGIYETLAAGTAINYLANRLAIGTTTANAALTVANALTLTSANWGTTTGAGLRVTHGTITDSDGTDPISSRVASSFSAPTFASTNALTISTGATVYIAGVPVNGTNTTITNKWALWVNGMIVGTDSVTDAANKTTRFASQHYTNSEEPVGLILGAATSSANTISIGGGSSLVNAATVLNFYTGTNNTTTTGTLRGSLDSAGTWAFGLNSGLVGIGTTTARTKLDVLYTSGAQLRLTYTDNSVYTGLLTDSSGYFSISPTGNRVGIGTTAPAAMLDVNGAVVFRSSGSLVTITADDQAVTTSDRTYIRLTSDNTTATNRTFTLSAGAREGQILVLEWYTAAANLGELADSGTASLNTTWSPGSGDTISLIYNGTVWLEISRTDN